MEPRTAAFVVRAALLAVLALWSGGGARAMADPPGEASTTFAIIGDYGVDDSREATVASLVASWDPAYVITAGDNYSDLAGGVGTGAYDESVGAYYGRWLKDITTTGTRCPVGLAPVNAFFPSLGNHDYTDAPPGVDNYLAYFNLPGETFANSSGNERYYDFVQGPIHFFVLNSNPEEPDGTSSTSEQARWLKSRLAASTSMWSIVYDHHPPYSSDDFHGSTPYMQWPFAAWGADAVVSGHAHVYERIMRDAIVYFVNGLGGSSRYGFVTPVEGSVVRHFETRGAQKVTVTDTSLTFDFYDVRGGLIDSYRLPKPPLAPPAAPTDLRASAVSVSRIALAWTDSADNETGFRVERSPDGTMWSQVATVGANVLFYGDDGCDDETAYHYRVRATNDAGDSGYSNVASATTPQLVLIHVGDLDRSYAITRTTWIPIVKVTVHDADHAPVPGALVTGRWSDTTSTARPIATATDGTCTFSRRNIGRSITSIAWYVTDVRKPDGAYRSSSNHDPDGDSNGTAATLRTTSLTITAGRKTVAGGRTLVLRGALTRGPRNARVRIYARKPGSTTWVRISTRSVDAQRRWTLAYHPGRRGTWYFQARLSQTRQYLGCTSPRRRVAVK